MIRLQAPSHYCRTVKNTLSPPKTMAGRPFVTYGIIIANVAVWLGVNTFLNTTRELNLFLLTYGVVPLLIVNNVNLISLVTHMFVHVNFFHILLNMYALFLFGRELEEAINSLRFAVLYFVSGVVASLFHVLYFVLFLSVDCSLAVRPLPAVCTIPAIGASGAIFGVMAGYAVFFPRRRLFALLYFIPLAAPAYLIILGYAVLQTLFMLAMPFSSVAYTAHVGGFLAGLIISAVFRLTMVRYLEFR